MKSDRPMTRSQTRGGSNSERSKSPPPVAKKVNHSNLLR